MLRLLSRRRHRAHLHVQALQLQPPSKYCYQLPQQINHPFDQHHALTLQPRPVYPEGLFGCDACGNQGAGFSYHCGPCGVDLHTTCATLPAQFAHKCHHHRLGLRYAAPYPGNVFSCDVCSRPGSKTWIYRCCEGCEFDAHLTCVAKLVQQPQQQMRSVNYPQNSGAYGGAHPRPQPVVMGQPQGQFAANKGYPFNNNLNQPVYGFRPGPVNGGGLANQVVIATVKGFAQATTGAFIQGIFGGGGGGPVMDGGSCFDGGYGGTDGGYGDGDGGSFFDGGYGGTDG